MTEKSKFQTMFEKLSEEEKEKVAEAALLIGDLIAKKGVKGLDRKDSDSL